MSDLSDLLERFRRGPELLAMSTTGAAGPMLDYRPEGRLSVRQIVCHLADAETVGAMRLRQILAEHSPTLQYFDEAAWAERLDYSGRKISHALESFRRLRADNHELLAGLGEEAFQRTGHHSSRGDVTLRQVVEQLASHLEDQVLAIQAVRAAYKEQRAQTPPAQLPSE